MESKEKVEAPKKAAKKEEAAPKVETKPEPAKVAKPKAKVVGEPKPLARKKLPAKVFFQGVEVLKSSEVLKSNRVDLVLADGTTRRVLKEEFGEV